MRGYWIADDEDSMRSAGRAAIGRTHETHGPRKARAKHVLTRERGAFDLLLTDSRAVMDACAGAGAARDFSRTEDFC